MRAPAGTLRYAGLAILGRRAPGEDGIEQVLFRARLFEGSNERSFVELSDFAHDGVGWRYVSGILVPLSELRRSPEGLDIDAFLAIAGGY